MRRRKPPERKPDPSVRELRRQISFGATTVPSVFTGSIKKKTEKNDGKARYFSINMKHFAKILFCEVCYDWSFHIIFTFLNPSGNPSLAQTGQSYSLDQSAMSRRPETLKTVNLQPSIEEDGESAG